MPLYEYHCEDCGRELELLVRGDEKPTCTHCESTRLTKLMSAPAAHVAGGSNPLPMMGGGCGRPQCGGGGCAGMNG